MLIITLNLIMLFLFGIAFIALTDVVKDYILGLLK